MKLALVTPRYPPTHAGGGEISARLLAEQLYQRDIADVTVYSFDDRTKETVGGVQVRRLFDAPQYPYTLPNEIAYRKLREAELDCDILHAYNMHLHPAVGRISREFDIPAVATLNAYPLIDWRDVGVTPSFKRTAYERTLLRFERPRLKRQMRNIDAFLPLSGAVEQVYRNHGFDNMEYRIIPNMLDTAFNFPKRKTERSEQNQLLYVGYLRDSKGVRYLIDAIEHLPPSFNLRIVGGGPEQDALEERVLESSATDRIELTGNVPYEDVTQAYVNADVFVHPGVWPEPFGRTILEAMQAGLPVVATNIGGPAETVPQEELLCEPANPISLAECIKRANNERDHIGAQNKRLVRDRYHPDSVVPQFRKVYQQVRNIK